MPLVPLTKSDNLSSSPRTNMVEREPIPAKLSPDHYKHTQTSEHSQISEYVNTHPHTLTAKKLKYIKFKKKNKKKQQQQKKQDKTPHSDCLFSATFQRSQIVHKILHKPGVWLPFNQPQCFLSGFVFRLCYYNPMLSSIKFTLEKHATELHT